MSSLESLRHSCNYDKQHEAAALSLHDLIRPKKLEA